ncbi:hypothetical protein [Pseudomonas leptonychotis]|uniref:hypothetical protein n=1 Tax=Pseudomonas leptonychotis TaxID=2448482 RepID=UPI00386D8401
MNTDHLKVLGFRHEFEIYDKATGILLSREVKLNRIPQAGIGFLIQSPFGELPPISTFYCGLFRNNFVADSSTSAADIPAVMGELVDYSEATRPLWERAYDGAGTQDNSASKAIFTPTADRQVYGSFIVSNPTKGANSGLLLSVVRFATAKNLTIGQEAKLVCGLTYIPTNVI